MQVRTIESFIQESADLLEQERHESFPVLRVVVEFLQVPPEITLLFIERCSGDSLLVML